MSAVRASSISSSTTDFKLRHYYFVTDEWKIALWDCISLVLYMLGEVQRY